jgi:RNA methyltransferase, TrmH family
VVAAIKHIASRDNPIVKSIATLAKSPSARRADGLCLLEGEHLAESYVERVGELESLVLRDDGDSFSQLEHRVRSLIAKSKQTLALSAKVFDELSILATPTGVLALARVPAPSALRTSGFVLALDDVQDPGNVGTLIRTAAAAGVDQVWLSSGSAFVWSVKTLRASQGANFHVDVIGNVDLASALNAFNGARAATLPRDNDVIEAKSLFAAKLPSDVALILSNEGRGLSPSLSHAVTHGLTIPMANAIESLNVASAGAIALFHIAKSMGRILF